MFADKVFLNGRVVTADLNNSSAEAVAVLGDKVYQIGKSEEIEKCAGPKTEKFDLAGKALLPGFIDPHCHMIVYGLYLDQIDCSYPSVKTIENILKKVKEKAEQAPKWEWIQGWGYDEFALEEKRYPTRWELDLVAPHHPVVLVRTCIHACVANSIALKKAGIGKETNNPMGGEIVKDAATGEPTGLIREMPAMDLIEAAIPLPQVPALRKAIKRASQVFVKEGITSIHDAGIGSVNPADIRAYQEAFDQDHIPLRVYLTLREYTYTKLGYDEMGLGIYTGFGNDRLRIGPVKLLIDGGIGARTAAMKEPYEGDPNEKGFLTLAQGDLFEKVKKAHQNGFQVSIHAIGDFAIEAAINCYESVLEEFPRGNHRHRIEHFSCATPDLIMRANRIGLLPIIQPTFIHRLGESYLKNLGDRIRYVIPCKSLIKAGMRPAGSSDRPVVPGNPLLGIYSAVTRRTEKGQVIVPEERVSVMNAIRMYTINGAFASFEEKIKGSIEPGKLADFVVLSEDLLSIPPEEIKDLKVEMTLVGGEVVYTTGNF
jgi:predicted amidohydrolase YtcJ